ncbi:MAG: B-box zinc finger protein, partial [Candidatus Thorarchaeota archaeon]
MNVDASHDSCQACQDSEATHLCEDCGAVLCLDCLESTTTEYYFCTNCHRNLGDIRGNQKPERCPDCDSDQIGVGRKIVEICPRCHSTRLILVEDRRRELAQELRKAILSLQYGHLKLREFVRHFTSARQLLVSLRMAKFLHYKWLEDQLETIQEEIPALKNRIVSQAEIVAKQMAAETKGLMDYPSWTADQFPFITGVTNRITELGERYKLHVDETLQSVRARLDELRGHINGLDYYRREFAGFYRHSELEVN